MANDIQIVVSSDSRQVIADQQKRIAAIEKELAAYKSLGQAGQQAGELGSKGANKWKREFDNLARSTEKWYKQGPTAAQQHIERMQKFVALLKMGKISQEEFNRASQASKKQYYVDNGMVDRLNANKKFIASDREVWQARARARDVALNAETEKTAAANRKMQASDREYWQSRARQRDVSQYEGEEAKKLQAARRAARERRALETEAKTLIEKTASAQERHNERVRRYGDLLRRGLINQQQFTRAVHQSNQELAKAGESSKWLSGMGSQLVGLTAGWLSVHGALRLVSAELTNIKERQKEAAGPQEDYGKQFWNVAKNYGELTPENASKLQEQVRGISKRTGVKEIGVLKALDTALATRGEATPAQAVAATEQALLMTPDAETAAHSARALQTGAANYPNKSLKQIAGEQLVAKQLSPTVDESNFASYVAPQLAMAHRLGDNFAEATALQTAISSQMSDIEGRTSTNAFLAFQQQLAEVVPEGKSTMERLKLLQKPEYAERKRYLVGTLAAQIGDQPANIVEDAKINAAGRLGKKAPKKKQKGWKPDPNNQAHLEGERKGLLPLVALVAGDESTMDLVKRNLDQMPKNQADAEAVIDRAMTVRNSVPQIAVADAKRSLESNVESDKLRDPHAMGAVVRETIQEKLKATGHSATTQFLKSLEYEIGSGLGGKKPATVATGMLEQQAEKLRRPINNQSTTLRGRALESMGFKILPDTPPSEQSLRAAQALDELVVLLKDYVQRENAPPAVPNVQVNVNMPGQGEKPAPVPAAGNAAGAAR